MENWIHEISKSYISSFSPKRKDLVENYVSLNEEQKLELFSQNVNSYLQEQFKNAFGFDMNKLSEENIESFLSVLFEFKGAEEVAKARGEEAGKTREERLAKAARLGSRWLGRSAPVPDAENPERNIMNQWGEPIINPTQSEIDQIRRERTDHRLDAAVKGDDALRFELKRDPGTALRSIESAKRSEAAAKNASVGLRAKRQEQKNRTTTS